MRVSLNHIAQYIDFDLPETHELVATINTKLGGVEDIVDLKQRYENAVIVKVESCEKHPNADSLNICMVNDGSDELTRVVCGAPNVTAGMYAVWLKPGAVVPSTADDAEPFVLGSRELRGVVSHGMMASPKELGFGDGHDGILEINPDEFRPAEVPITPGVSFAAVYGLDDVAIDIENKMFTHRPDLFGQIGVAREIAGIHEREFTSPDWYTDFAPIKAGSGIDLAVSNTADEKIPRLVAVAMKNVTVKPSPLWLQAELVRLGSKPINTIVDATNYIMLLTAQPTHAYDYDKLKGKQLIARMAEPNEELTLLNRKNYTLDPGDIVIADAEGPVGLAGIMGGAESEVTQNTTNIVLEVANFNMYSVRKSSMRHGLFTDAVTRFNKGQSPYQTIVVLKQLIKLIQDIAGGEIATEVFDVGDGFDRQYETSRHGAVATVTDSFINERLGTSLSAKDMSSLLANVELSVDHANDTLTYRVPFWRTDIVQREDIVEEVGRLHGFDKLPRELPRRSIEPPAINKVRDLKQVVRSQLATMGANEALTYSFVHKKLITRSGQNVEHAFQIANALSPELQYYRLSVTPSLLDKIHSNNRAGHDTFALFEFGKSHFKGEMDSNEAGIPNEDDMLAFVVASSTQSGAAYFMAKHYLTSFADTHEYDLVPLIDAVQDDEWGRQLSAPYDSRRSMALVKDNMIYGVVGEFKPEVRSSFKLLDFTAGFELHLDAVAIKKQQYAALPKYPSTMQDISIRVAADTTYATVESTVSSALERVGAAYSVQYWPVSIYRPDDSPDTTFTFRVVLVADDHTLTQSEATDVIDSIGRQATETLDAVIV